MFRTLLQLVLRLFCRHAWQVEHFQCKYGDCFPVEGILITKYCHKCGSLRQRVVRATRSTSNSDSHQVVRVVRL